MVEVIEDTAGFERLREEWNELLQASRSPCFFLTWEWLYTWWKHLAEGRKLLILAARSGRELVAIAPLCIRPPMPGRLFPFRLLEFLGTGAVGSDYLDFIIRRGREEEALLDLSKYLADGKLVLELAQLKKGSSFAANVAQQLSRRDWSLSQLETDVCPFIPLSGLSWEDYVASLSPAHRYNFKRRLKNLTKRFEVRFEQARTEAECGEALGVLIALHERRWRSRGRRGAFHTPQLLSFHEEVSRRALERGWLRLFVLRLDGKPVASVYDFRYGHTFYFYQSGFDPSYEKESVGLVAMGLTIRTAIEEGAEEYDLLHGDESYKLQWACDRRELSRLELYPPSTRGLFYSQVMTWGRASRRAARRLLGDDLADRIVEGAGIGFWRAS
ncbi:MAG: GNAT family N-acetyltransferase [Deltaproteobacteria bacterium]|nr:GNAT family N-acetyltransferase [Deltaproteobacteria bacterium]